jgi:two-component system, OmpR family, response regulator
MKAVALNDTRIVNEPAHRPRILLVEDALTNRQMVVNYLEENDMLVTSARGHEVTRKLTINDPSLVILDLPLRREHGLDLVREIRSTSEIPIIITDHRRDEVDRIVGLELGADDYIAEPFGLRELLARIRAVLRRGEAGRAARPRERGRCRFGDWQLDRRSRRLTDRSGAPVMLTKGEYALLTAFLDAPQRPLTREHLLQATRKHEDIFDRSIDVQVLRLRRKLKINASARHVIQTERGIGYVFNLPVEALRGQFE